MGRLHVELTAEAAATGGTTFASSTGDRFIFVPGATIATAAATACTAWTGATSTSGAASAPDHPKGWLGEQLIAAGLECIVTILQS